MSLFGAVLVVGQVGRAGGGRPDRLLSLVEQLGTDRVVDGQRHERLPTGLSPRHLHRRDVDPGRTQYRTHRAHDPRAVEIAQEQQHAPATYVPDTDTPRPSGSAPRMVTRLG